MARRMTLEGAEVRAVCELMPYSGGLTRNIVQCLEDFDIPLYLSHTVVEIHGKERLSGVTIAKVDENRQPIQKTRRFIPCDTLLLSVGLLPENELSEKAGIALSAVTGGAVVNECRETSVPGIFACGNVLHVHDLVDFVSDEAETAGKSAAAYLCGKTAKTCDIPVKTDAHIRYSVPQHLTAREDTDIYFRVSDVYKNAVLSIRSGEALLLSKKLRRAAPGEMEKVHLSKQMLAHVNEISLEVEA